MAKKTKVQSNVSDDTIRKWMRDASEAREKLEEAKGSYRAVLKAAKNQGVDTKQLIACMNDRKQDVELLKLEEETRYRYRKLFEMPTVQMDLFVEPEDEEHKIWSAGELGYASGKRGDDAETACPFSPGTAEYVRWHDRFDEGVSAGQAELQPNEKKASTRRRRKTDQPAVLN